MHTRKLTTLLLPLSLDIAAQADENIYTLDDIVVTAARTAQTADQTLAPVSVVTRKEIEKSQATNVPDLLRQLPGVQITSYGGPGAGTSLSIRGTNSNQSLVLINGLRIGSATLGAASLELMDPDQIERIEVVRGPRASLYGADAIGGVINIITRADAEIPQASLKASYGSRNTRTASANFSGSNEQTHYHFGFSRFMTDGYDRTPGNTSSKKDKDAYDNTTASLWLSHELTSGLEVEFNAIQSEGTTEFDPDFRRKEFRDQAFSSQAKYHVSEKWTSTVTLGYNRDDSEIHRAPSPNQFDTHRKVATWQNDVTVSDDALVTAGLDYYRDKVDSSVKFSEKAQSNKAAFIQGQKFFDNSDLQLSLRRDNNEAFGNVNTGNVAWGVQLPADMRLISSYGTAFRAPTFQDLYAPDQNFGHFGIYKSDPNLKPEESKNYEFELRGNHLFGKWSVSIFQNDIDHLITNTTISKKPLTYRRTNINKSRIRGLELTSSAKLDAWVLAANLTILSPKNLSYRENNQNKSTDLPRKARKTMNVSADYTLGAYTVGGTLKAQGSSYNDASNKERVAGFATVDLRASLQVTKDVKAGLKVVNLLNKKYQSIKGYREEPRGIFATVTWSPKI